MLRLICVWPGGSDQSDSFYSQECRYKLDLAGRGVVVSSLERIRRSAAAMAAKSPALSQRTREGQGTRFCAW